MTARPPFDVKGKSPEELIAEIRGLEGTCAAQDAAAQKAGVELGKLDIENRRLKKDGGGSSAKELREDLRAVLNEIPKFERRAKIEAFKDAAKAICRGCQEGWPWANPDKMERGPHRVPDGAPFGPGMLTRKGSTVLGCVVSVLWEKIALLEKKAGTLTEEDIKTAFPEAYFRHGKPSDTVFVVIEGSYSDLRVDSVYRTKEEAEAKVRLSHDDGEVYEMKFETIEVSKTRPAPIPIRPDLPANFSVWKIIFTLSGTILSTVKLGAYDKPPPKNLWIAKHPSYSNLIVYCRAKDEVHAVKIATDKRAAHLAGEAGIS